MHVTSEGLRSENERNKAKVAQACRAQILIIKNKNTYHSGRWSISLSFSLSLARPRALARL
jgi:hypothetical protein